MAKRHFSEVAQLLDIAGVVGKGTEEVVPPATQALVSVIAALHGDQPRLDLHLVVDQRQQGVPVAPVEGVIRLQGQLHVLLRHGPLSIPLAREGRQ